MQVLTVEGDLTTVDTRTLLTTQGSVTAPSLVVPAGVRQIVSIHAAAAAEGLADGSATFILRLGGGAVKNGEQTITVAAGGRIAVQSGSDAAPSIGRLFQLNDAGIDVNSTDVVTIAGEMAGQDLGTGHMVVTLVFA
jgi:hypothetical protein